MSFEFSFDFSKLGLETKWKQEIIKNRDNLAQFLHDFKPEIDKLLDKCCSQNLYATYVGIKREIESRTIDVERSKRSMESAAKLDMPYAFVQSETKDYVVASDKNQCKIMLLEYLETAYTTRRPTLTQ